MNATLATASLADVARMLRDGSISDAAADEYIARWNAGPCRFTYAERCGVSISQIPRCGECGVIRREHDAAYHYFVN